MNIGLLLQDFRYVNRIGIREFSKELGISPATLSRIENGYDCDIDSFKKLWNWLLSNKSLDLRRRKNKKTGEKK